MKKAQVSLVILIILVVIVILILGVLVYFFYNRGFIIPPSCDYSDSTKTYVNTNANCVINFLCVQGNQAFKDNCGCGCQKIITQTVVCNSDSNCGEDSQRLYCKSGNLYSRELTNTCNHPGTSQSFCSSSSKDILTQTCNNGCSNNQCIISSCDYNSGTKTYVNKNPNCIINFLCTANKRAFHDECGCGCELVSPSGEQIYCTAHDREAQACFDIYSPVCGWFSQSIQCLRYPCAQVFSNSCFACMDNRVEYYTNGACSG